MEKGQDRFESRHIRNDGSIFDVEVNVQHNPSYDDALVVFLKDISERKKAEEILVESERKFRSYIENAPEGVFVIDEGGIIVEINNNAELITGFAREELIGISVFSRIFPDDISIAQAHFKAIMSQGEAVTEVRFNRKDGVLHYLSVEAVKLSNTRFLGFVSDITERKQWEQEIIRANEKAEASDRLKTAFINNISHEIRTPLNSIQGLGEVLADPNLTEEKRRQMLEGVHKSSNRLMQTIAKGLVELMGGTISVDSAKGAGSRFSFTVPAEIIYLHEEDTNPNPIPLPQRERPLVLVAEDDDLNFTYIEVLLETTGCDYLHAFDGAEAVELCRQHPDISFILMDIKMPVMDGLEATQLIKQFKPTMPVVALTAYAQTGDEQRILNAGCDAYYSKPIKPDVLKAIIRRYAGR